MWVLPISLLLHSIVRGHGSILIQTTCVYMRLDLKKFECVLTSVVEAPQEDGV